MKFIKSGNLFLIFFLAFLYGFSQNIENLQNQLEKTNLPEQKSNIYLQIARIQKNNKKYEQALESYLLSSYYAEKTQKNTLLAIIYDEIGFLYRDWLSNEKSLEYFNKAYTIKKEESDLNGQIESLSSIAWTYYLMKDYPNASKYYQLLLNIYKNQENKKAVAEVNGKLSIIYELDRQYDKSISYSQENLTLYRELNQPIEVAKTLNNLGFLYRKQGDAKRSMQYFNQAVDLNKQELTVNNTNEQNTVILTNLGVIHTNLGDYTQAMNYYNMALKFRQLQNEPAQIADVYNHIGANYFLGGNNDRAKSDVLRAIDLAKSANAKPVLLDSYRILSDIYKSEGNFKEFDNYNKLFTQTQDQINNDLSRRQQDVLNRRLLIEQLESKIRLSISEGEKQKLELEQQKLIVENERKEKELANAKLREAEKERALERARAEKAEQDRKLALTQAKQAQQEKELAVQRATTERKEKELAVANEEKAKAIAEKAEKEKLLAEERAKQADREKQRLVTEQRRRNQLYLLLSGIAFLGLVTAFTLVFLNNVRKTNKKLKEQNFKIQEQNQVIQQKNIDLEQQKEEIASQRDKLMELNDEINQQKEEIEAQRDAIEVERDKSESLLLNILPAVTAKELKEKGIATPRYYEMVTVLFTDFRGFTQIASRMSAEKLVKELDQCFVVFDEIIEKHNLEKIKTIGDAYMCAGGIPTPNTSNPIDAVKAALEIQQFMEDFKIRKARMGEDSWELRIGIHTGPLVAGVVGKKKFAYDIWGDAVNTAARMESSGEEGRVNISGTTYELVKDYFDCIYRGKIPAKNKGDIDMYFVNRVKDLVKV